MLKTISAAVIVILLAGCNAARPLSRSERAYFPPALAYQRAGSDTWHVLLEGAVSRKSWLSRRLPWIQDLLDVEEMIPDEADRQRFERRIEPFLANHIEKRSLPVLVGDQAFAVGPTDKHGYIRQELALAAREADAKAAVIEVFAAHPDEAAARNQVRFVAPEGVSVVSDIDDTIRITECQNTKKMLKNTFLNEYRPVPGMADLYQQWSKQAGVEFHYVTGSSFWLCTPMCDFLRDGGFPAGSLHFRAIQASGFKAVLSLFNTPTGYKRDAVARLIDAMPNRRYVLVGDSGEHDPEEYSAVARRYPGQVRRILIRDVTCETSDSPRYQATFGGLPPALWRIFKEPDELNDALKDVVTLPAAK